MGEAACVMHAFSYTSGISNEANEGNPMYALEESVSLGRFMSESLSWEKWSSFSRNRYVEEAEMYARPGSVKQKKAYFEAHFKRMAALKAAALLEQASSGQGGVHLETQVIDDDHIDAHAQVIDDHIVEKEDDNSGFVVIYNEDESKDEAIEEAHFKRMAAALLEQASSGQGGVHLETHVIDDHIVEREDDNTGFVVIYNENESKDEAFEEADQAEEDELQEQFMDVEEHDPSADAELEVFHECVADHNEDTPNDGDCELNTKISEEETEQTEEKVEFIEHLVDVEKQKPSAEVEYELAKMEECHFECSSTNQDGLQAASRKGERIPLLSAFIPSSSPISKRNPKLSSYMPSAEPSSTPAKVVAVHPGKENTFTPIGRKSWIDDPNKKRTPLRMSINREFNRLISPVIKKMGSSSKASNKDCTTPLKTPAKASVDGMTNGAQEMTPQSGKRRARALFDSSSYGGSKGDNKPRWQFLSTEGSKSPAKGRSKGSSPVIPKSFCLSTSRAPRRKERLEEKFNAKATESIQQHSKLKEKPKEVTKLRQSFCFGAKLSSESFREQQQERLEVPKEKSKVRDCQKGSSRLQNMTSLPPRKPETKGTKGCQIKSK